MPSTWSPSLKIELIATGEQTDAWGPITNNNFQYALEQGITGYTSIAFPSDANYNWAATYTNSNAPQSQRYLVVRVTGALTATRQLIVPTIQKEYVIYNNTTGSQSIDVKTAAGGGVIVPNGYRAHLFVDGTDTIQFLDYLPTFRTGSLLVDTPIPATSGGTGTTTATGSGANVLATSPTITDAKLIQAINTQTGTTYTPVLADQDKLVTLSNVSAITVTIPANASVPFPIGSAINFIRLGAGSVTFSAAFGVTINSTGLSIATQYGAASAVKLGTDNWLIIGGLS